MSAGTQPGTECCTTKQHWMPPDTSERERLERMPAFLSLSHSAAMVGVLGSWSLTERLLMFMPHLVLVLPINKTKTQQFRLPDRVLPEHRAGVTGFSCIIINKTGINAFCTSQPSPCSSPAPSLASYIPPAQELGTFCATAKQAT